MYRELAFAFLIIITLYLVCIGEHLPATITLIAAISYLGMILKESDDVLEYRYADWALTTPLILFLLLTRAGYPIDKVVLFMVIDVLMIATGYLGKKEKDSNKKLVWLITGMILFIPLIYALLSAIKESRAAILTVAVWSLYPLLWVVGEKGIIDARTENNITAVLDVVAKAGFGLLYRFDKS